MVSILLLGFLIGLHHALEADHVAAVASAASGERSFGGILRHGTFWGLGHAATLLLVGGGVILAGLALSDRLASALESLVGAMLIGLGGWVIFRLWRDRVHFHTHRHADGVVHLHAHSHAGETKPHDPKAHAHRHPGRAPLRSLLVGMTHGMAGSAALVVLAAASLGSQPLSLLYVFVFGLGSVAGMALLSAVIAVPLAYTARALTWAHKGLQAGIGVATAALGAWILIERLPSALAGGSGVS